MRVPPSCSGSLVQEIPGDGADCSLQIRSRIDKKVLATFDWEQFSNNLSDDVAVSWTKDSKAFALSELFGRGWGGSLVYFHLPNSSWTDVEIPLPDTGHPSKEGWETRDKGHYYADHWIGNDVLVLDYLNPTYRNASKVTNVFDPEYTHSHYSVSLQLIKGSNGKPAFKQIALHELPGRIVMRKLLRGDFQSVLVLPGRAKIFLRHFQREAAAGEREHPFLSSPVDSAGTIPREMNRGTAETFLA
jgi:hypothetical protein